MAEELRQEAGYWTILAVSIGAVSGTTLFFGASLGARYAGNLLLLASVLLGIIAVYIAAVFGELVGMFPKAGGAYEFSKHAYGRFVSFIVGWVAWLVGNIATVVVVVGAVNAVLPESAGVTRIALSVLIIVLLNLVAYLGIETGRVVLITLAAITVAIVAAAILSGFMQFHPANLVPLFTHPFSSVFIVLFFTLEAFFGWEAASYLAEETKNPTRVIPKAMVLATAIVAVLSFLAVVAVLGAFSWEGTSLLGSPLSEVAGNAFGSSGRLVVNAGIFLALVGAAAGSVITMPRLLLALARDRLFLGQFRYLHKRFRTPHNAILFQTVVLLLLLFMGFGSYQTLLSLLVPLALIMYIFLLAAVPILRRTDPQRARPFKVVFGSWGPLVVAFMFLVMMMVWVFTIAGASTLLQLSLSLIGIGLPLYLLVELYYDPKAITEFNDVVAYVSLLTEKVTFSRTVVNDVLTFLGPVKGKRILEFGCGVGTLTLPLLREVGSGGKVYATHFSKNHLKITRKRAEIADWNSEDLTYGTLVPLHDPQHFIRVHPDIRYADAVVSVGMLGYIHDMNTVLRQLRKILPLGGRICFVEYSDFFHLLPNVEWLGSDRMVEKMFRDAGFSVKVVRKRSLLWNRIYLYGIKFSKDVPFV